MDNDQTLNNSFKRKRKLSTKHNAKKFNISLCSNTSDEMEMKNPFLSKTFQNVQSNKEIFDTLSDVSTDDSDIQITHLSNPTKNSTPKRKQVTNNKTVIELDSNSDTENMFLTPNNSIDYLMLGSQCNVIQEIDYLKFDTHIPQLSDHSSSLSSSDSSDSFHEVIHVDDDVSFIIDSSAVVALSGDIESRTDSLLKPPVELGNDVTVLGVTNKPKRKRKSQKRFPNNPELRSDARMFKYWSQRYDLFERFDMGIKLDKESWYSVTAEYIAKEQAELCRDTDTVLDGFCGAGGNTIQFSYKCKNVVAVDIDLAKVELTRNNCDVYGVDMEKVSLMRDDFYAFANLYKSPRDSSSIVSLPVIDVVFLSPPWGGQDYLMADGDEELTVAEATLDIDKLMTTARVFGARTIMLYLPRNTDQAQLHRLMQPGETIHIVQHQSRYKKNNCKKVKAITVVYKFE